MKIFYTPQAKKFVDKLNLKERAKVREYINLFKDYTFTLDANYLKKVAPKLWELRPGTNRLFFTVMDSKCIIIYAMKKKSQKITKKTMHILLQKIKDFQ